MALLVDIARVELLVLVMEVGVRVEVEVGESLLARAALSKEQEFRESR